MLRDKYWVKGKIALLRKPGERVDACPKLPTHVLKQLSTPQVLLRGDIEKIRRGYVLRRGLQSMINSWTFF